MDIRGAGERVREVWRWESSRFLLVIAVGITVVISLFEIRFGVAAMLREIASNFITASLITFVTATMTSAVGLFRLGRDWGQLFLLLVMLALGGVLGGLLSWGINDLLFPYNITHPLIYLLIVATLSIVFGLAIVAYQNVSERLEEAVSRLAEKEVQEQRLLRLKTEAELEALRARVNPHFLFNTLNSIASLIPSHPDRAENTVQRLSNLLRYILSAGERGLVPLGEELDIVTEYLEIEKQRLGGRLDYVVDRGDLRDGPAVPAMILQPLVENSVKYAIMPEKEGGRIRVECRRNGDRCLITIADTGRGFDRESTQEGFGIAGVRQRLELTYPGSHEFDISTVGGVAVRITIPITDDV